MTFNDPVVGDVTLVRDSIQSEDYKPGVSGWSINRDGTAEFNGVVIRGTVEIGDVPGNRYILMGNQVPAALQSFTDPYFGPMSVIAVQIYYLGSQSDYSFTGIATGGTTVYYVRGSSQADIPTLYEVVDISASNGADVQRASVSTTEALLDDSATGRADRYTESYDPYTHVRTLTDEDVRSGTWQDYTDQVAQADHTRVGQHLYTTYGTVAAYMAGVVTLATGVGTTPTALAGMAGFPLALAPGRRYRVFARVTIATTAAGDDLGLNFHWGPNGDTSDPMVCRAFNINLPKANIHYECQMNDVFSVPTFQAGYKGTISIARTHGSGTLTADSYSDNHAYYAVDDAGQTVSGPWTDSNG